VRRLIHALLGAAAAALLGLAHAHVPGPAHGPVAASGIVVSGAEATRVPEWRAAREHTPQAPPEKAARTRRQSVATGAGALPATVAAGAVSAPVVLVISGTVELLALRSECGHCTRAPRPPPTS